MVGVVAGEPFDFNTWSGSSAFLFKAIQSKGYLHSAISSEPPKAISFLIKALSFNPDMQKWKFKYHLSQLMASVRDRLVKHKLNRIDGKAFGSILQIGAWYDCAKYKDKKTISYHDGNLYSQLASPLKLPDVNKFIVKKALQREKQIYSKIDRIFPMSEWLADSFIKYYDVNPKKVQAVGAGINLPYIKKGFEKDGSAPTVLFVGIDFERKGGKVLLEAFSLVTREIKNARLMIIGPELSNPPKGVECLGLISKSTKEGIEKLSEIYCKASVFVMPSYYEPFGIAFLEAMAHKLPCIGTDICAIPEIIDHNQTGFLVKVGDHKELGKRIVQLLKDKAGAEEMGRLGYMRYKHNYTWDIVAERIIAATNLC